MVRAKGLDVVVVVGLMTPLMVMSILLLAATVVAVMLTCMVEVLSREQVEATEDEQVVLPSVETSDGRIRMMSEFEMSLLTRMKEKV